jgi:hypothetical protein
MNLLFVIEEFSVQSPAQHLLDRFLIGYPRDGHFHRPNPTRVTVHHAGDPPDETFRSRTTDYGLRLSNDLNAAAADADAIVLVWKGTGAGPIADRLRQLLSQAPRGCRCFVHGLLADHGTAARELVDLAKDRNVALASGTPLAVTWHLPPIEIPPNTPLSEALIVVQGPPYVAEYEALEALLPVIEQRRGGEPGIVSVTKLSNDNLRLPGKNEAHTAPLLAAAISRSDTPQGAPVEDGRTQDLVKLGLVPKLARNPRGWRIEHRDGFISRVLVLNGVIADYNFAVRTTEGKIISAQVYRPPAPAQEHFSRLAALMEDYFATGNPPWPIDRTLLETELMQSFRQARTP